MRVLKHKCRVYAGGCRKRGRVAEAERYEKLAGAGYNSANTNHV
jgi:hypothetical protein